MKRSK